MKSTDETSAAPSKRARKKAVNFASRRTLRFSEGEERAVDDVRRALSKTSGRDLGEVSFSEALRLLITDKAAAAEVEAMALAIERSGSEVPSSNGRPGFINDELGKVLGELRNHAAHVGGNVNQITKKLNSNDDVSAAEIRAALSGAASLRALAEDAEQRLWSGSER